VPGCHIETTLKKREGKGRETLEAATLERMEEDLAGSEGH
jgi:hypothetical protein